MSGKVGAKAMGVALVGFALGACASGGGGPAGEPRIPQPQLRGVPGFDTREYPGDETMRLWYEHSPYEWVGYYLPAPCHTGRSWLGTRERLEAQGWGTALLFVGEQDWANAAFVPERRAADADSAAGPPADADVAREAEPRCTAANLTEAKGRADAAAAAEAAAGEGFAAGAIIFLDVERVDTVSAALEAYVRGWTAGVLEEGRYAPGLYAHGSNAEALHAIVAAVAAERGAAEPPLWVASSTGFLLVAAPEESGFPAADVWQGAFDRYETWGGETLRVDANVANTESPSDPAAEGPARQSEPGQRR